MKTIRKPWSRLRRSGLWLGGFVLLSTGATCREDLGDPDYSFQEDLVIPDVELDRRDGSDPFRPGDRRLNLDRFYEGDASRTINIDNDTRNFFFFDEEFTGVRTFDQEVSIDQLEGRFAARIVHAGTNFWGGGIFYNIPLDLSTWTTMNVAFKSSDPVFADIELLMTTGIGPTERSASLFASEYGYVNDGEYHVLRIPLADFVDQGLDLTQVQSPFTMVGPGFGRDQVLLVDELYWLDLSDQIDDEDE